MTFGMTAIAAATVVGGGLAYMGSKNAASAQTNAANQANATQADIFNQQKEMSAPYREAGVEAQNQLRSYLGLGGDTSAPGYGKYSGDFNMSNFTADPGYAFRLSEGMKGLNASAAARGGLISGAALKAATNYGQQAGSQEYQNAFTRYQTNRNNQIAPLQNLTASGQAAAAGAAANAGAYGSAAASNTLAAGNAAASGYVGGANAVNQTVGSLGNQYMTYQNTANQTAYQNNVLSALNNKNMSATGY
ncbi:hypothetical protein UFOVP165_9 [uncultured Caudovirales phage]|uniref:DNA transfer protein n=1 Tax=uncultured Caudovirales phage TaxID=2100421 RepID=A0A6J5TEJ9_9CAUD|nr:hypothetical protein UFOVP72_38 [uncultured Caudovirales phage]CAB5187156.1 hypothetical protein UFOVP165_9 [uncultured Caudovirales phage]